MLKSKASLIVTTVAHKPWPTTLTVVGPTTLGWRLRRRSVHLSSHVVCLDRFGPRRAGCRNESDNIQVPVRASGSPSPHSAMFPHL